MKLKRGQATLFIVLLIILVIGASIAMYERSRGVELLESGTQKVLLAEDRNVQTFVQECLELTSKNGLFYLGFSGGRLNPDAFEQYYKIEGAYQIPYFYVEGKNDIPLPYNEPFWTNLLDRYLLENFEDCINGFSNFPVEIRSGKLESRTAFADRSVIFSITYPVTVTRNFEQVNLDEKYTFTQPLRLREMLKAVSVIVQREVNNDRYIHWDYLTEFSRKNFNITVYPESDSTLMYRVIDLENEIDYEPYIIQFANKVR